MIRYTKDNEGGNAFDPLVGKNKDNGGKINIDYSKMGTAKCKRCGQIIVKGELRIGKYVLFKRKYILQYYHVQCAFDSFRSASLVANTVMDMKEIERVENITSEEKLRIVKVISEVNTNRSKPLSRPSTIKYHKPILMHGTSKSHKSRLIQYNVPSIKIIFTNSDQLTPSIIDELKTRINQEKPLIIAVSEIKPKNASKKRVLQDYEIPNYTLHHVNLDTEVGRGLAIYSHSSLANSINQIDLDLSFEEVCLLEVRPRGGDVLLLGSCYRSPTQTPTSDGNNEKLNRLLYVRIQPQVYYR